MSKVETLRLFVQQRLTAAAAEIFELFERTISEYEEEQRKLLHAALNPEVRVQRADVQPSVSEDEEQQDWSPSLDQEDPSEVLLVKDEDEELRRDEEQLQRLQEAEITFTSIAVDDADDVDEGRDLRPQQRRTQEVKEEDCGPEPGAETEDWDWEERPGSPNPLQDLGEPAGLKVLLHSHGGVRTGGAESKPLSCSVCQRSFSWRGALLRHSRLHAAEKPAGCPGGAGRRPGLESWAGSFACPVCGKRFAFKSLLERHLTVHTGEKPFGCSVCGKRFTQHGSMSRHLTCHVREKPVTCSLNLLIN